ncbi:MAG: O-antigen ligase family protein [Methylobacter sp.]
MSLPKTPIATQVGLFSPYLTTAIIILFSLIYLDIPNYLFVLNPAILPKYFYYSLAIIVAPFFLLKFREFVLYMASPFFLYIFAEIIIHSYDMIDGSESVVKLIVLNNQYLILSLLFGFTVSIARTESYEGIFPILAIAIPLLVIIDFIIPGAFYPMDTEMAVQGRASAMYINPTRAAEAILLTCLLAIPVIRLKYRMPLLLLAGGGLIVTFSRGPIIVWMLFWLFLLITRKLPKYCFVLAIGVLAVLPLSISIFKSYLLEHQDFEFVTNDIVERLDFFKSRSLQDNSAQERIDVLESGWKVFLEHPIFGAGTGVTYFQSNIWPHRANTHNQIVMLAAEQGIIGITLWIMLLALLWRGNYFQDKRFQLAAAILTFLMSFFNHLMLTELYWLITYALVSGLRKV